MAKNDKVLLDGIIDERIEMKLPSIKRDEIFEFLAFEQILKDFDLSRDEIELGCVDGRNDGGIDGFFIFVNGHFLSDLEAFPWPKAGSALEVWVITCKHHDTFKQATLDNLAASLTELFDFALEDSDLKADYSDPILRCRANLKLAYRKLSSKLSSFSINFSYASRGDTSEIGDSIVSRGKQIESIAGASFGNCLATFHFHGATEIVEIYRRMPQFSLELPFVEALSRGERYVLLVNLKDYFMFVSDERKLRRYLFDSNVRDFMGLNRVNEDIKITLDNSNSPDFWWLNNGITILATAASVIGKLIKLQDIQIVNGLQTTESIFRHFERGGVDPENRSVLVRIIVSQDAAIRDAIIRATNNQTTVELSSLHATDKIQRDIEDVLKQNNLYYERRINYYANQGHSNADIISPLYLASGFLNLILKKPHLATTLKSKFMKSSNSYEKIFSTETSLKVWPRIAFTLKLVDNVLERVRPSGGTERFLKGWRQITSLIAISRLVGNFDFSANDLINLDFSRLTHEHVESTWDCIKSSRQSSAQNKKNRTKQAIIDICQKAATEFQIEGLDKIVRRDDFPIYQNISRINSKKRAEAEVPPPKISMEFALKVNEALPPQPWKPGIQKEIIAKLGCTSGEYAQAIKLLIEEGLRNRQKDGVVYDQEGNVVSFDPERVSPNSLESKEG